MTKQPTQTEIQQAEELQRLGLCQGAKEWIAYSRKADETCEYYPMRIELPEWSNLQRIGPLATASECWPEIRKILKEKKKAIELSSSVMTENQVGISEIRFICGLTDDDLDQAFRQALIELACQQSHS